jgi:hypothetical protein
MHYFGSHFRAMDTMVPKSGRARLDLKWTSHQRTAIGEGVHVYEKSGGPVQTRTADLYRVKVAEALKTHTRLGNSLILR